MLLLKVKFLKNFALELADHFRGGRNGISILVIAALFFMKTLKHKPSKSIHSNLTMTDFRSMKPLLLQSTSSNLESSFLFQPEFHIRFTISNLITNNFPLISQVMNLDDTIAVSMNFIDDTNKLDALHIIINEGSFGGHGLDLLASHLK